jgi:hypothetical protein
MKWWSNLKLVDFRQISRMSLPMMAARGDQFFRDGSLTDVALHERPIWWKEPGIESAPRSGWKSSTRPRCQGA